MEDKLTDVLVKLKMLKTQTDSASLDRKVALYVKLMENFLDDDLDDLIDELEAVRKEITQKGGETIGNNRESRIHNVR